MVFATLLNDRQRRLDNLQQRTIDAMAAYQDQGDVGPLRDLAQDALGIEVDEIGPNMAQSVITLAVAKVGDEQDSRSVLFQLAIKILNELRETSRKANESLGK